MDRSYLSEPP